jgi:hypothetical protein
LFQPPVPEYTCVRLALLQAKHVPGEVPAQFFTYWPTLQEVATHGAEMQLTETLVFATQ